MKIKGDIKDRGNIKWTAMMLPEHIAQLRDWKAENDRVERPDLTEWDLVALEEELDLAYKRKCQARIQTWRDGRIIPHRGIVEEINIHKQVIILADPFGDVLIDVKDIVSVQCA